MNKSIIIFGLTDLADIIFENLRYHGKTISAFTIHSEYIEKDTHLGLPVVPFETIERFYHPSSCLIYLCVGYKKMNMNRAKIFSEIKDKGYYINNYIHPSAIIMTKDLGEGNIIMEGVKIGAYASIGNANILYPNSLLAHHSSVGEYNYFSISSSIAGHVNIGNNCYFGNNSYTKNNVNVSDFALIGAGAYVDKNIASYSVLVPPRSYILEGKNSLDFI